MQQIASCESTGRELSFEWSYHRISSIDSKVRVTLQNSIKHSGSERVKPVDLRIRATTEVYFSDQTVALYLLNDNTSIETVQFSNV